MNRPKNWRLLLLFFFLIHTNYWATAASINFPYFISHLIFNDWSATENTTIFKVADEICDNRIDDDGDGLIDAFDADCQCNAAILSDTIFVDGSPCEGFLFFSVENDDNATYQWYRDGMPLRGQFSHNFGFVPNEVDLEGIYDVSVIDEDGQCQLIGSREYRPFPFSTQKDVTFCPGTTQQFGEQTITEPGEYTEIFPSSFGCDSTVTLLVSYGNIFSEDSIALCEETEYEFGEQTITEPGTYTETFSSTFGCDSTVTLQVSYKDSPSSRDTIILLAGEEYQLGPQTITKGGTYRHRFANSTDVNSCDSLATLLVYYQTSSSQDTITLCEGVPYQFGDKTITTAGVYTQVFPATDEGGDSTAMIVVIYKEASNTTISETINEGETYAFDGNNLSTSGRYEATFQNTKGCDSIITLNLMVIETTGEICDNKIDDDGDGLIDAFDDDCLCNTLETPPNLVPNGDFENHSDCCPIIQSQADLCLNDWIYLNVTPEYIHEDCLEEDRRQTFQERTGITIEGGFAGTGISYIGGHISESIGVCLDEPMIAGNTYTISLDIGRVFTEDRNTSFIDDDLHFTFAGITDCNQLTDYRPDRTLCDSGLPFEQLIAINLLPLNRGWNNFEFEVTPSTTITAIFVKGDCADEPEGGQRPLAYFDNVVIQKKVTPLLADTIFVEGGHPCEGIVTFSVENIENAVYQWYKDGMPLTGDFSNTFSFIPNEIELAGVYHVFVTHEDGQCQLIGSQEYGPFEFITQEEVTLCEGATQQFGDQTITEPGEYTQTFFSTFGCDSIVTLLVSYDNLSSKDTITLCAGVQYEFGEETITESGEYTQVFSSTFGCDSTVTLLVNYNDISSEESIILCAGVPYEFGELTITEAGTYTQTFTTTTNDCDSIATLLVNYKGISFEDSLTLCAGTAYEFGNITITEAGTYTHNFTATTNTNNCDSIVTLAVHYTGIPSKDTITLCTGMQYEFGDTIITTAGVYTQSFPIIGEDCDSTAMVVVIYQEASNTAISETITEGETYTFNGEMLNTTGVYLDTLQNTNGCDSFITLDLIVMEAEVVGEICDNGIDDDGDGLVDIFDEDCQCMPTPMIAPVNLVPNGDFEKSEEGCCTRSTAGEDICIEDWTHKSGTPDFIRLNCVGISTPAEAELFSVPLEGGFMGILIRNFVNFSPGPGLRPEGMSTETIGLCLPEPLIAGERYTISLDASVKGNLQTGPLTEDLFFTVNGVPDCDSLPNYIPERGFCDLGLPYEELALVNLFNLVPGWTSFEFEFTPSTNLEALFVTGDCDLVSQNTFGAIALFDNLIIQKKESSSLKNEIIVEGDPCAATPRFLVEFAEGATYQWYQDSILIPNRIGNEVTFEANENIVGTHQVYVTFADGSCQLIGPYVFNYPVIISQNPVLLCEGATYQFGTTTITAAGVYTQNFPAVGEGCDSTITIEVFYQEASTITISETITEGETYVFNDNTLNTTGVYSDTLQNTNGCDSIITLDLIVMELEEEVGEICDNGIDDDGDGLIDIFDADCQCKEKEAVGGTTTTNLVPNGGFEQSNGCCVATINTESDNCVEDWILISNNPDYYNPACGEALPEELAATFGGIPDNAVFGFTFLVGAGLPGTEGMGTCLKEPMIKNTDYEINVEAIFSNTLNAPDPIDLIFTVYGISDCATFDEIDSSLGVCENEIDAVNLFSFNLAEMTPNQSERLTLILNDLPTDIAGIFLSANCEQAPDGFEFAYILIENVEINPVMVEETAVALELEGPFCNKNSRLFVETNPTSTYQWYKDSVAIAGETNAELLIDPNNLQATGNYHLSIISESGNCQLLGPLPFELSVSAAYSESINLCAGEFYQFGELNIRTSGEYEQTFTTGPNGCDSIVTLTVNFMETMPGDTSNIQLDVGETYSFYGGIYDEAGIYQATLTTNNGCDSVVYLNLNYNNPCTSSFRLVAETADQSCEGADNGWIEIAADGGTLPYLYSIDGGTNFSSTSSFENLSEGNYAIVVIDENGCSIDNSVSIETNNSSLLAQLPNDTTLIFGQSIPLAVAATNFAPTTYNWSFDSPISCPTCPSIRLAPTTSGTVTITLTDENGCEVSDEMYIEIKEAPKLYFPTAFSPNSDGNNDYFKVEGKLDVIQRVEEMQIFNRWGDLVYEQQKTADAAFLGWDGSFKNQKAVAGVYLYVLKWKTPKGNSEIVRGDFTLFR